jgi:hypothetical protein
MSWSEPTTAATVVLCVLLASCGGQLARSILDRLALQPRPGERVTTATTGCGVGPIVAAGSGSARDGARVEEEAARDLVQGREEWPGDLMTSRRQPFELLAGKGNVYSMSRRVDQPRPEAAA